MTTNRAAKGRERVTAWSKRWLWLCSITAIAVLLILVLFAVNCLFFDGIPQEKVHCWSTRQQFWTGVILSVVGFLISLFLGSSVLAILYKWLYGDENNSDDRVGGATPGKLGFSRKEADKQLEDFCYKDKGLAPSKPINEMKRPPKGWYGFIERLFFTVAVAVHPGISIASMFGWIATKMLTNLNRAGTPTTRMHRTTAMAGLVMGLCSMFFALLGGLMLFLGTRLIGVSLGVVSFDPPNALR